MENAGLTPIVTALLVTHDGEKWLPQVISSIFSQTRQVDRIIAIDTSSKDQSLSMLKNAKINTIQIDRGAGFGESIQAGLKELPKISHQGEEFLWILHDDFAPHRDALENLLAEAQRNPLIAATGPKLRSWFRTDHLLEVGISIAVNGARWTGLERDEKDQGQRDNQGEVLAVSTAGALIRREIFEEMGGFDSNLSLFRDDVDFGWRAHRLGYSITVAPGAWGLHAEAGASERREIDVDESFLHRPLLLDRKNAAYVLLVNSPWWSLPWVVIQLGFAAGFRSLVNLLGKLPGYAGDELGALALLIVKPGKIISGRRKRKNERLLSARVVAPFIPPLSEQLRLGWERFTNVVALSLHLQRNNDRGEVESEIGNTKFESSEDFNDGESFQVPNSVPIENPGRILKNYLKTHPFLWGILFLTLVDIFYSRSRYGHISGGALPIAPGSSFDLFRKYFESWHPIGLGSAVYSPAWVEVIAILSFITLSSPAFLIAALWFLAPLLAALVMYRALKRLGANRLISTFGGVIYALSPVVLVPINQGRLGSLFLAITLPTLISFKPIAAAKESKSFRKIFALSLLAGVIASFNSFFLLIWSLIFSIYTIKTALTEGLITDLRKKPFLDIFENLKVTKRFLTLAIIPGLLTEPWSIQLLIHPSRLLLNTGFPLAGSSLPGTLLFNPSGPASPQIYIFTPIIILYFFSIIKRSWRKGAFVATIPFAAAIALTGLTIAGNGSVGNFYTGDLLALAQILILFQIAPDTVGITNMLRRSSFGLRQIAILISGIAVAYAAIASSIWAVTSGANSLVKAAIAPITPAFLTDLSNVPSRPKLLLISENNGKISYYISRGEDLSLGDPEVIAPEPAALDLAISGLIDGSNTNSAKDLGTFGINYIFLKAPVDQTISRSIDGQGGFQQASTNPAGIIWKVVGAAPRVEFQTAKTSKLLNSELVSSSGMVTGPGVVDLAENYDRHWSALLNGNSLSAKRTKSGMVSFNIPATQKSYLLSIFHQSTSQRMLYAIQVLILLGVVVMTLPAGRKRKDLMTEVSHE